VLLQLQMKGEKRPTIPLAGKMKKKNKKTSQPAKWAEYSTVGIMFPASIAVGLAVGYFLDQVFKTSPYLVIIFTLYGVAAGFWNLVKITKRQTTGDKGQKTDD